MSDATIYNWLKQENIDRGEVEGLSTDQALELAAKRRIKQLKTELGSHARSTRSPRRRPPPNGSSR
jgi:hypothetical protein